MRFPIAFLLVGCSLLLARTAAAQEKDKPAVRTGPFRGEIVDPVKGDVIMKVSMFAPAKLPADRRLTLLLLFHGFKGNENNYYGRTIESLKKIGLIDQFVVISGKSKGPGWTTDDDEPALRLIDWAKKTYPIDSRRVFVFGSSNGAAFVGRFGWEHQDLLAGVVGYCGGYKFAKPITIENPAENATEWYFVHGSKDNPKNSRRACDELKAKGYRTIFRQMDGYGHTDIWDSGGHPNTKDAEAVREDWLRWAYELRHKQIAPTEAEKKVIDAAAARLKTEPLAAVAPALDEITRIGGPPADKAVVEALSSPHAEVRAAAAATTEKTLYGPVVVEALVKLLKDGDAGVRKAAIAGLSTAANRRYAAAQSALAEFAADGKRPEAERVAAIEGLGRAVKTALLGNLEDGVPVWALVKLLEEEGIFVRRAAFAALKDGSADGFGYAPDGASDARAAAVAKWREWCTAKCGAPAAK